MSSLKSDPAPSKLIVPSRALGTASILSTLSQQEVLDVSALVLSCDAQGVSASLLRAATIVVADLDAALAGGIAQILVAALLEKQLDNVYSVHYDIEVSKYFSSKRLRYCAISRAKLHTFGRHEDRGYVARNRLGSVEVEAGNREAASDHALDDFDRPVAADRVLDAGADRVRRIIPLADTSDGSHVVLGLHDRASVREELGHPLAHLRESEHILNRREGVCDVPPYGEGVLFATSGSR